MTEGEIVNDKYMLEAILGSGGFGKVFRVTNIKNKKEYALKLDLKRKGQILTEAKILADIQKGPGIPKLYDRGKTEDFSYMVITLLGDNLSTMLKNCGGRFSLGTVANVGFQLLNRVEFVHNKGYIHRDLKPQQFILDQANTMIYLVDYGLAKKYLIAKNHIPFQTHCPRAGNSTFASLNNHMGIRQSRRDDLESISYMLIYMLKGKLPWQQKNKHNSFLKWQKVFILKASISIQDLCRDSPPEFFAFTDYCRMLKFEEKPDYDYLRGLLTAVSKRFNMINIFDWCAFPPVIDITQEPEFAKKSEDVINKAVNIIPEQNTKQLIVPEKKPPQRRSKRSKTGKEKSKDIFKSGNEETKFQKHAPSSVVDIASSDFLTTKYKAKNRNLLQNMETPDSRLKPPRFGSANVSSEDKSNLELIPSYRSHPRSSSVASSLISDIQEDEESCTNSGEISQGIRENICLSPVSAKKINFFKVDSCDVFESYSEAQLQAVSSFSKAEDDDVYNIYHKRKLEPALDLNSIVPIIDESELTPRTKKLPEFRSRDILYKLPTRVGSIMYQKTLSKETDTKITPKNAKCAIF